MNILNWSKTVFMFFITFKEQFIVHAEFDLNSFRILCTAEVGYSCLEHICICLTLSFRLLKFHTEQRTKNKEKKNKEKKSNA